MVQGIDKEFYNLKHFVKFIKNGDEYIGTLVVSINLGNNNTYIQKKFKNIKLPNYFRKIDDKLFINFNHILMVKAFDNYCYLTSNTKKIIGKKYLNYNIKVTGKNKKIKNILKDENMWIKIQNNYINLDNVTNVTFNDDRIFINFKNSTTNLEKIEDIKPEYIAIYEENKNKIEEKLNKLKNWIKIENKYINLNNVYNLKILDIEGKMIVFLNFISNITKNINNKKIISTEFAKIEFDNTEEAFKFLKQIEDKMKE